MFGPGSTGSGQERSILLVPQKRKAPRLTVRRNPASAKVGKPQLTAGRAAVNDYCTPEITINVGKYTTTCSFK
jgi:hypothetical protein